MWRDTFSGSQNYFMKSNYLCFGATLFLLSACSDEPQNTPVAPPLIAQQASEPFAQAAASSPIATQILNSPQEQDILASSRQAMQSVTASDIAEFQAAASQVVNSASSVLPPPLPQACAEYYQRVEQCFANQNDGEGLLSLNEELKTELLEQNNADEQSCRSLNRSFDAVARNLGCSSS